MSTSKQDLLAASQAGVLNPEQVEPLLTFLAQREARGGKARFSGTHVLYYLGGLLAIGAATLFTTLAVEAAGMGALFALTALYALAAFGAARWFEARGFGVPAGIFATLAISLTPLAVYALQHLLGFWPDGERAQAYRDYHRFIDWRWMVMELSTLVAGVLMLQRFRYTFLTMPVAVTLWYMGMDVVPALLGLESAHAWAGAGLEARKLISLVFGLLMLALSFWVDLRSRNTRDYAFWLYLFGLMTFWCALSVMGTGALAGKLVYLGLNAGLVFLGAVLGRRVFAVFGGLGIAGVLGDLSWNVFEDSLGFVAVLTLVGFALIAAGVWWSKHEEQVSAKLRSVLPPPLRELLEARTG